MRRQDLLYSQSEGKCAFELYVYLNTLLGQDSRQKGFSDQTTKLVNLFRLYRCNQVSRFGFWTSAQELTLQLTGAWHFSITQRMEAPSNTAFSTNTHCWALPVQSSARGPRTQGQCINLGTPGECHMQSRNEIVYTVRQLKSRIISFLFLRVGFYIYCSIILGLRATAHHGTLSHNM